MSLEKLTKLLSLPTAPTEEQFAANEQAWSKHQAKLAAAEDEERRDRRRERLDRAGLLDCLTVDAGRSVVSGRGLDSTKSIEALRAWQTARMTPPWLVLAGPKGCGKSVAAACAVADYTGGAFYLPSAKVVPTFAARYGDALEHRERVVSCGFLVLDDPGSMDETPAELALIGNALVELLDARKTPRRATILTTNLTRRALFERYRNDRLPDRLMELCQWVGISEGNKRTVAVR